MLSFIWDAGGDIAVDEDGEWVGELATEESVAGLATVQDIMQNANAAPADTDDAEDFLDFCNGEVGMLMGPGWKMGQITGEDGCPGKYDAVLGAFAAARQRWRGRPVVPRRLEPGHLVAEREPGPGARVPQGAHRARRTRPSSPRSG